MVTVHTTYAGGNGYWADWLALRLMAIYLKKPILVVAHVDGQEATLYIFPPTTARLQQLGTCDSQKTSRPGMFIPSCAYDPDTLVLYYNGVDHYAVTWVPQAKEYAASDEGELLQAFKEVAAARPNWFMAGMKGE